MVWRETFSIGEFIDVVQTLALIAVGVVNLFLFSLARRSFTEGVSLLRESLDRIYALERRVEAIERALPPPAANR